MKAVVFHHHGDLDQLLYKDFPDPQVTPGEVVVEVKACALNYLDIYARLGGLETPLALPHIGGADVAGVVAEVGPEVTGVTRGDPVVVNPRIWCGRCEYCLRGEHSLCDDYTVIGWHRHGGFAEFLLAPAVNLRRVDDGVSFEEIAAVPVAATTAWRMLISRAALKPGEEVLILSASGGVASFAVQIAKLTGARVIATSGSKKKLDRITELGADEVLSHRDTDWDRAVLERTGGRGVDVVFQTLGGDTWQRSLNCAAKGGRVVVCSGIMGAQPEEDLATIWFKQLQISGSTGATPGDFAKVIQLYEEEKIRPVLDQVLPLAKARQAQERMVNHEHFGKIVLLP